MIHGDGAIEAFIEAMANCEDGEIVFPSREPFQYSATPLDAQTLYVDDDELRTADFKPDYWY